MSIKDIKEKMLAYQDFYGGDLVDKDEISKARTRQQLADILNRHRDHMTDMLADAESHLKQFKDELGLPYF